MRDKRWSRKRTHRVLNCETLEDRRLLTVNFLPGDAGIAAAVNDQQFVAVEKGDSNYLAVWMDERPVLSGFVNSGNPLNGNGQDIYGQILDRQGQPVGDPIVIASMGHNQTRPDIAWNPAANAWLVAFDSEDPDWYFHEQVYAVRVSGVGELLDAEPQLLFEQDGNQGIFDVDVASDGSNWAIVATKFHGSPLNGTVFGRRMAADGSMLDLQPQLIAQGDLMMSDIEYAGDNYLIASKNRITDQIYTTLTDTSLNAIGSRTLVGGGYYPGPSLSSNGDQFLVVGQAAHRISSTGQILDAGGIALGGSTSAGIQRSATWNGESWSVGFITASGDIGMQRIDSAGTLLDTEPMLADVDAMNEQIALVGDNGDSIIAFSDRPGGDQDIRGVRFDSTGVGSAPFDLSVGLARQSYVTSVDGPGSENLIVFVSQISGESRILSQRVLDDGTVIDAEPTIVAVEPATLGLRPQVGWNGTDYMIGWGTRAQRFSANNQPIGVPLTTTYPIGSVSAAGDTFVVGEYESYYDTINDETRYRIYYSRISATGTPLDATPVLLGGGAPALMSADVMGDRVIMSYRSTQGVFIEADGTVSDPFDYSNSLAGSTSVAVNGNQALFVYTTGGSSPGDSAIMGRFVQADGSTPEWEFLISDAPGQQLTPDVAWIGDQYVAAWSDYRHIEGIQQQRGNIRAARVTDTGVVREPNGFTVTSSATPDDLPNVVGGGGESWVLFSALHGAGTGDEVQRIGYQHGPIVDYPLEEFDRAGIPGGFATVSSDNLGVLLAGESHHYEIAVAPGEQAAAIIRPEDATATVTARFVGEGPAVTAGGPGEALFVPLAALPPGGTLTLEITSDTTTAYSFDIHRNENVEALIETASAVAIDDAELSLGRNSQYAAIGQSDGQLGGNGFTHYNDPSLFVDISTTGTSLVLDDGFYGKRAFVNTTFGNELLPAGLITVARDGIVVGGFNDTYLGAHQTFPNTFYLDNNPAVAPLWQILGANNSTGLGGGSVYFEETTVNDINTVIVQWDEIPAWHDFGAATFQIQVFETGPVKARYVYEDIAFGDPGRDGGAAGSVGLQLDGQTGHQFSFETASLVDGDVLDFLDQPTIEDVDEFTVDLLAGETIDVAVQGVDAALTTATLELLDPRGNLLTTGTSVYDGQPILNFELGVLGHQISEDGTYTVRLSSVETAEYEILVTKELALEIETQIPSLPRELDLNTGAMGSLDGRPSLSGYSHYNDPSRFVDISTTGTPLFFDHGDGVTPVYSHVSNALMPGQKFLVGNDGTLMLDEAIDYFSGDVVQTLPSLSFELSALLPFATDLEDSTGNVFYEERLVDGVNTLIVQWDSRSYFFQSGTGTFQVQLFDRDPSAERQLSARFAYADVNFDNPLYNGGAEATVGVQLDRNSADSVSIQNPSILDGDVIDFYYEAGDRFEVSLQAGETITLHTLTPLDDVHIVPANQLDPGIAILDNAGQLLVFDSNSVDGKNAGLEFTAPVADDYQIVIYTEAGKGEYVIQTSPGHSLRDGDFDNNGAYEIDDIDQLTRRITSFSQDPVFDLNGDNRVDLADRDLWLAEAGANNLPSQAAYVPGDANLDGFVDGGDFLLWNANKFQSTGSWGQGDFNADGRTDGLDFLIWNANKFSSADRGALTFATDVAEEEDEHREQHVVDRVFASFASC